MFASFFEKIYDSILVVVLSLVKVFTQWAGAIYASAVAVGVKAKIQDKP